MKYFTLVLALAAIGLGGVTTFQAKSILGMKDKIDSLEADIISYQEGIVIQNQLREKNLILENEVEALRKEIENAEGSEIPLPDGIKSILNGVLRTED